MKFDELDTFIGIKIPKSDGKLHTKVLEPYDEIKISLPGYFWQRTEPQGGDFLVKVSSSEKGWDNHSFTHGDIFEDIYQTYVLDARAAQELVAAYFQVVSGRDPNNFTGLTAFPNVLPPLTFLRAVQCLALAEHRSYARNSASGGGKWLPWRFAHGIAYGYWTAAQANQGARQRGVGILNALNALEGVRGMPSELRALLGR